MSRKLVHLATTLLAMVWIVPVQAEQGLLLEDGVLVDPQTQTVYLMLPGGGIEAVSTASGDVLWQSRAGDRPLSLDQGRVLAQVDASEPGKLELVVLETSSGEAERSESIALPQEVLPTIDDGLGRRFELRAVSDQQLAWRYERRVVQGMPSAAAPRPKRSGGLLNMESGYSSIDAGDALTEASAAALWRLPSPMAKAPVPALQGRQFDSRDGSHILVTRFNSADAVGVHRWEIYTAAGVKLGAARSPVSFAPFIVVGQQLLFVTPPAEFATPAGDIEARPLSLRSIDLQSGEIIWERALRDTQYPGPFPT